jgi:hypothetical protein
LNVRSLNLDRGYLHADALALLITKCKALRDLSYNWRGNFGRIHLFHREGELLMQSIDFCVIIGALERHHNRLRTLTMYNTGATNKETATVWASASLAGFDKLEKVCVDASILFEKTNWARLHEVLPASLTYLRLENTWPTLMTDLRERNGTLSILDSATKPFPALTCIDIKKG